MNKTNISGRFTRDLNTSTGTRADGTTYSVTRGTVAVDNGRNADGSRKTLFFPIVAWNKTGELLAKHCKKGDRINLWGKSEPTSEKKEDGSYVEHYVLNVEEIEFLEPLSKEEPKEEAIEDDGRIY